jgi:hypothetical protein
MTLFLEAIPRWKMFLVMAGLGPVTGDVSMVIVRAGDQHVAVVA